MTDIECLQKLSTISGYCCAEKDKDALDYAMSAIKAKRPHARWVGEEYDGYADGYPVYEIWSCSRCGIEFRCEDMDWQFCPRCGAQMDEEAADDK